MDLNPSSVANTVEQQFKLFYLIFTEQNKFYRMSRNIMYYVVCTPKYTPFCVVFFFTWFKPPVFARGRLCLIISNNNWMGMFSSWVLSFVISKF